MVHFTEKIYRQKELLLYIFDENKYFSSATNLYFQFHYSSKDLIEERSKIIFGFNITLGSKRIFILPRFNCSIVKKFTNNPEKKCTYADIFQYHLIDKKFRNKFRESVYVILYIIIYI